jgi:hypothetical protein
MSRDVHSFTHWLRPRNPPLPPAFGLVNEGAIGQQRQTTSLCNPLVIAYTANKGPVRIQNKCLVPIYVFLEMKLISKTEF